MASLALNISPINTASLNGSDASLPFQTWDVGVGSDAFSIIEFTFTTDVGVGSDEAGAALYATATTDVGIGTDATDAMLSFAATADVGVGVDSAGGVLSTSSITADVGVGADVAGGWMSASATTDTGQGAESSGLLESVASVDVGIGIETIGAGLSGAETADVGVGVDSAILYVLISSLTADVGIGTDQSGPSGSISVLSAYTVNTDTGALSTYVLPVEITGMMDVDGVLHIAAESGLYALDAADDQGTEIVWSLQTGLTDFGSDELKRLQDVNVLARVSGDVLLKVVTSRGGEKRKDTFRKPTLVARAHRDGVVKIGQGLSSVYWGLELEGQGFAEIDRLIQFPLVLSRRR